MALLEYAAEASLYKTSRSYWGAGDTHVPWAGTTVVAQQDPCAIAVGGGGGGPIPHQCAAGQRCCEPAPNGLCFLCAPSNAPCP
jgi:hypothetical protein